MRLWLLTTILKLLGRLSLPANHWTGAQLGNLMWALRTPPARHTEINLGLCFPDMPSDERRALARRSLQETGKAITEIGWMWTRPVQDALTLPTEYHGLPVIEAARESCRKGGLIVITPHLGAWEYCGLVFSGEYRPMALYRPPRQAWMEPLMQDARARGGTELVPLSQSGLRILLKALREGRTIGMLPDQEPDLENGVFAGFFGVPANTMTMLSRLAQRPDTKVVLQYAIRKPRGAGYDVYYESVDKDISHKDPTIATRALNRQLENCISRYPEQYLWTYRRFRLQPDGSRRNYR